MPAGHSVFLILFFKHSIWRPLHQKVEFVRIPNDPIEVPNNYARVMLTNYDEDSEQFSMNGDIVPRLVQQDLFDHIKAELPYITNEFGRSKFNSKF